VTERSNPEPKLVGDQVTGVILAGGKARRMGGVDKGLIPVNGRPMISWVIDVLRPQVAELFVNANRNLDQYRAFGHPVIDDGDREFRGPLAGIASGLRAASGKYVVFAPCDSPLVCSDLTERLHAALSAAGSRIAAAHDGERLQPVFALLERALLDDLMRYLDSGGRKIDRWYAEHGFAQADFSDVAESFANINAPDDKQALERRLGQGAER
jgi:molybdopterin-guanine dinucleotide biosynthesis protein A